MRDAEDGLEVSLVEKPLLEAWSVVVEHPRKASTDLLRSAQGRVRGKVAALGVAAHVQPPGQVTGHRGKVLGGEALGWHGWVHDHLEVLAPSGEGVVRPSKPDVGEASVRAGRGAPHKRDGRKLRVAGVVEDGGVVAQLKVAEARACREGRELALDVARGEAAEQAVVVLGPKEVREVRRSRDQRMEAINEAVCVVARGRDNALAANHAELGERGGIHGAERPLVEGLKARVEVVEEVHRAPFPLCGQPNHTCLRGFVLQGRKNERFVWSVILGMLKMLTG